MIIVSWNVNGINTSYEDLKKLIQEETPDILCIQEIKTINVPKLEGYTVCINPSSKDSKHYGTAIYSKVKPLSIRNGFGDEEFDLEGRVINFEFEDFNLYNVYVPSGARKKDKLESERRLKRKYRFFDVLTEYVYKSDKQSIICGDFNRISKEIDGENITPSIKYSGFAPKEQEWFSEILTKYVDAFRIYHEGESGKYTWWPNGKNFFNQNRGFRFDYFLVSNSLKNKIARCDILDKKESSDHAPIVLELEF